MKYHLLWQADNQTYDQVLEATTLGEAEAEVWAYFEEVLDEYGELDSDTYRIHDDQGHLIHVLHEDDILRALDTYNPDLNGGASDHYALDPRPEDYERLRDDRVDIAGDVVLSFAGTSAAVSEIKSAVVNSLPEAHAYHETPSSVEIALHRDDYGQRLVIMEDVIEFWDDDYGSTEVMVRDPRGVWVGVEI